MEADASGSRPVLGQPPTGKKTVAIYGCSFAFGVGVNFDETFCSHLQAWLPAWRIENHGVPAYSGHRNLIQLERDARWGVADYVTFCWIPDHFRRNVAAASTIQRFSELQGARIGAAQGWFPRAAIGPDGNLTFRKVKFPRPDLIGIDLAEFLPDACHLDLVGAKIFQRAHRVVTQAGGVFFVTTLQGELSPMVVGALEKDGIPILDASLDADKYLLLPDDRHPNAAAHKLYAERIRDYLRARESVASARSDGDAPAARTAGDQAGIG
jgi:hypothetical protein